MTDPTNPESGQEQSSEGLPIPKLESASAGSSTSSVDTKAIAKEVASILRPDFEKMAQSTKDRRIAQIQKRLGIEDLTELEELGVQIPENVKTEYRFRQLESSRQIPESSPQASTSQGSGADLTATDVSEVVKQYGLDANNAEVLEALRGTYRDRDHFEVTMARLALKRTNQPQPSAAESSSITGSTPSPSVDEATLVSRMTELQKDPVRNRKAIEETRAKLGW